MAIRLEIKPEYPVQDLTNPEFYYDLAYRDAGERIRTAEEDWSFRVQYREERILIQHFLAKNLVEAKIESHKRETNQWPPITPIQTSQVIRNHDIEDAIDQSAKLADQRLNRYLESFYISHGVEPGNPNVQKLVSGAKDAARLITEKFEEKKAA